MENDYNLICTPQQMNSINNYKRINKLIKQSFELNQYNNNESIKILDIGCSYGLNSIHQVNSIINEIKNNDKNKTIEIYHSDLPNNNFTLLFNELEHNLKSYLKQFNNVYTYCIGKSYDEPLLPNNTCDIIFSYNCFHWVNPNNEIFKKISKDLIIVSKPSSRSIEFDQFGYNHLTNTLLKRYDELKVGGILSCNFGTYDTYNPLSDDVETVFKLIKNIYRDIVNENQYNLTHDQVDSMYAHIFLYNNDQVNHAIKQVELKGLKLINKEQILINWNESNDDPASNLASYVPIFTKRFIKGTTDNINNINNEFKRRLIQQYNQNSNLFNFTNTFDLLLFKKIK